MKSFGNYFFGIVRRPGGTFALLMRDKRRLRFGIIALAINAVLYTLVYVFLTIGNGAPSIFKPWLDIPADNYYQYNQFFLAPSMFMSWIIAAGVAQLLSRLFSGKGTFEDTLSVFGFSITIACLASLLHDFPDAFLGAIGILNLREYEIVLNSPTIWRTILLTLYTISILWFMILFSKGLIAAQKLKKGVATIIGIFSYCVYQFTFIIFNR